MSEAAAAAFRLLGVRAFWLGAAPDTVGQERWRLSLAFAPGDTTTLSSASLPPMGPGAFQLVATDGGPPAAVIAAAQSGSTVTLTIAKLHEAGVNSQGRWFRLVISGAPGVVADGAAARFALSKGGPVTPTPAPEPAVTKASISYLSRDYPALVQTLQSSLRLLDPAWRDVSPGDVGVTLTELLAYAADNLSYYQDAVATEAYLSTARRRLSVRRHARQLGYSLREGCNARAWVQVQSLRPLTLPRSTQFLVAPDLPLAVAADGPDYDNALQLGAVVFESLADSKLDPSLNSISIHDWGQHAFELGQGALAAVLRDAWLAPLEAGKPRPRRLDSLRAGDVLMFEHLGDGSAGGRPADPQKRWPVRLRGVERLVLPDPGDPDGTPVVSVTWGDEDALPFALPVSDVRSQRQRTDLSIASGNLVPVDQGRTVHTPLPPPADGGVYTPAIPSEALVYAAPYDADPLAPASIFLRTDPNAALAAVQLAERRHAAPLLPAPVTHPEPPPIPGPPPDPDRTYPWRVRADLLSSGPFARDFVVEGDNDRTLLRFGDGEFGRRPDSRSEFTAVFRVGDMSAGAVAREAIATLAAPDGRTAAAWLEALVAVRNPLAASGAAAPDPINLARRLASVGVRPRSLAALDDYVNACLAFRDVDQAAAEVETSGSWPVIVVYIRRRYGLPIDNAYCAQLAASLEDRMIGGRRLDIRPARAAGVAAQMDILLEPGRFPDQMTADLQAAFSPVNGFFCLDRWPLGSTLYASAMVSQALQTPGVVQASVSRLDRLDCAPQTVFPPVMAAFGPHEYPSVDNAAAERFGHIDFRLSFAP